MDHLRVASCLIIASLLFAQVGIAQTDLLPPLEKGEAEDSTAMTPERMRAIVGAYAGEVSGPNNNMVFDYEGANLVLISDTKANRMRIITPVLPASELTQDQLVACMLSNYHLALDARYAVGNGLLYSTFVHPMKELSRAQLESAIRQVARLRNTFGEGYSSGEMGFGLPSSGQET